MRVPLVLLLLALLMAGAWGLSAGSRELAFFRVRAVEIRGTRYLQPSEVVAALQIDTLRSLWEDLAPLRRRVLAHPQVSSVTIGRRMPGTIVVTVRENLPVALVPGPRGLVAYDSSGKQLPIDPTRADLDLPLVTTADPALLRLAGAIRRFEPTVFTRLTEVRRTGPRDILLLMSRSYVDVAPLPGDSVAPAPTSLRVRVPLGLSVERLADIFPVESDLARRQTRVGELDLRYRDQVIARLQ